MQTRLARAAVGLSEKGEALADPSEGDARSPAARARSEAAARSLAVPGLSAVAHLAADRSAAGLRASDRLAAAPAGRVPRGRLARALLPGHSGPGPLLHPVLSLRRRGACNPGRWATRADLREAGALSVCLSPTLQRRHVGPSGALCDRIPVRSRLGRTAFHRAERTRIPARASRPAAHSLVRELPATPTHRDFVASRQAGVLPTAQAVRDRLFATNWVTTT